jgi:hypothetical protein
MSLRTDRVLSQAWRYAQHRKAAPTAVDKLRSAVAYGTFVAQFDPMQRQRIHDVYRTVLAGVLVEDRRSRGRQRW